MSQPPDFRLWGSAALFAGALLIAVLRLPGDETATPAAPRAPRVSPLTPAVAAMVLPTAAPLAGPASLAVLADGRLAAAWLAAPADDEAGGAIWFSVFTAGRWRAPQRAVSRESTAAGTFARLERLGRPQLYAEGSWLHLWYESLPLGGWAGAAIVHSLSTDGGRSWSKAERLSVSPLAALGNRLLGPPEALTDGGLRLPVATRFTDSTTDWLRFSATGRIVGKTRQVRQAAEEPCRADRTSARLRLASGRWLLAGHSPVGGHGLHFWLSADDGRTWSTPRSIEPDTADTAGFSDPQLAQTSDGHIHLVFTAGNRTIRHLLFSEAWLEGGTP